MKSVLNQDLILKQGDDLGPIPKGVGLERLRYDGEKLVDLVEMTEIWVEPRAGVFILHAIEVPGATLVAMTYAQRKRLVMDNGVPRLKTDQELVNEEIAAEEAAKKDNRRRAIRKVAGDAEDQIDQLRNQIALILDHLATQSLITAEQIDTLAAEIPAPTTETFTKTIAKAQNLKTALANLDTDAEETRA